MGETSCSVVRSSSQAETKPIRQLRQGGDASFEAVPSCSQFRGFESHVRPAVAHVDATPARTLRPPVMKNPHVRLCSHTCFQKIASVRHACLAWFDS
mmetsp:Transcript_578/g.4057  ORF Transcript_578/g.4057 Transcript_578/m.4057 type:complete len:97 (+) Transcript_578:423-713(+)